MPVSGIISSSSREVPSAPTISPNQADSVGTTPWNTGGAARISFTAPTNDGGLPVDSYTITAVGASATYTASVTSSPGTITGLPRTNNPYTLKIAAVNGAGTGTESGFTTSVNVTTVPQTPSSVSAADSGSTRAWGNGRALVTFTAGDNGGFSPSYTATSSPGAFVGSSVTPGVPSPIEVTGLASNTSYTFTVKGTSIIGPSDNSLASNPVLITTRANTMATPTATAGNASANVAFTPLTGNDTGGTPITGYVAVSSPGGFNKTGLTSPLTVTGLTNGTAYTFTVRADNANGTGPNSLASNSVTPVVPGPNFPNFVSPDFPNFPNFPNFTTPNFPNFTCAACCQDTGGYYCCGSFQLNACWYQYDPCCGTTCGVRVENYACG
jgi:hypothetical protein